MCKYRVRVKDSYPDVSMQGVEVVILEYDNDTSLIGFPLNSSLGWYNSERSTEYRCWWISEDYLEPITTITRSKFR